MPDFATRLAALGLSQAELRRWIERHTGRKIAQSTISRWVIGDREADPWAVALLAVIKEPKLIEELRR